MNAARFLLLLSPYNLLVNGNFTQGASVGWSATVAGASITGDALTFDGVTSIANGAVVTTGTMKEPVVAGQRYRVTYTIAVGTTQDVSVNIGGTLGTARKDVGTYSEDLVATNTTSLVVMARSINAARTGSIDNISVRRA